MWPACASFSTLTANTVLELVQMAEVGNVLVARRKPHSEFVKIHIVGVVGVALTRHDSRVRHGAGYKQR